MRNVEILRAQFVPCVSTDCNFDVTTAIKDKGNGNTIAANDIDEDYESLLLAAPKLYAKLEEILNSNCRTMEFSEEIAELLAEARGETE